MICWAVDRKEIGGIWQDVTKVCMLKSRDAMVFPVITKNSVFMIADKVTVEVIFKLVRFYPT